MAIDEQTMWDRAVDAWGRAKAWNGRNPGWGLVSAFGAGWLVKAIIF